MKRAEKEKLRKILMKNTRLFQMIIKDNFEDVRGPLAEVLGINRDEVGFIYDMFDPVLFSALRFQTIKTMLGDNL